MSFVIVESFSVFAPAKLNLFLAITGKRPDGFHDLVSVAVQLDFGDTLRVRVGPEEAANAFALSCDDPEVPCDETNLVLKAAQAFAAAWAKRHPRRTLRAQFALEKRIPMGAGLGGGSSDAVAALRALNRLVGPAEALSDAELANLAAGLGSDCPLFLHEGPVVMRGRGEQIAPLPAAATRRLRGRRVLVFKPGFAIPTPWAYARLAAGAPTSYLPSDEAEQRVTTWIASDAPAERLCFNNMEPPAFAKFLALPALLDRLRRFGLEPRMSGSGSACFAWLTDETRRDEIVAAIRADWGDSAFVIDGQIA